MGHVETQDEVEGEDVVVLAKEDTEPFEHFLPVLSSSVAKHESVEEADGSVDGAVDQEGLPDALVEASLPQPENPVETDEARIGNVLEVGDRHPRVKVFSRLSLDLDLDLPC